MTGIPVVGGPLDGATKRRTSAVFVMAYPQHPAYGYYRNHGDRWVYQGMGAGFCSCGAFLALDPATGQRCDPCLLCGAVQHHG